MTDFAHLHVHSDFSLQDAAVSIMALADRAEKLGMSHLALTDHGNMFGVMEFVAACEETVNEKGGHEKRRNPVKPIIGCEVYVSPCSRFDKKGTENENRYYHLILLAMNREGYFNLVKLCSFAYTEGFYYRPRIDDELLSKYHGGLIALSACVSGEIPRLIQSGNISGAEEKARHYRDLFGSDENGHPNFYLEIQDHGIPAEKLRGELSQKDINTEVIAIARRTGIPLVATNDVHYLDREDSIAHDILLCIGTGKVRTEEKRKKYYGNEFYFKSGDEMSALFPEYPEAINNTLRIAGRCNADIPKIKTKDLPKYLPEFKIPAGFDNADIYLRHLALNGLAMRYAKDKEAGGKSWEDIQSRTLFELDTIIQMGFTGYFLIVADFINWAKERGIPVGPGRGSGAGSIVAYSLRITDIDPLKYKLLFERFLNPERISMPDFDIDFAREGRDDVIKYVIERYGRERAAQIITFGTLGAKAVIKDVARVLGISIPESDMITKLIPKDPDITLAKAIEGESKLKELVEDPRYIELFELARKLEGLKRHSSIHAAGVVIGKSDLHDFVPLYRDPKSGIIATQYSKNFLEPAGLAKMDFLGLKTLDVIKHTEDIIRRRGGQYSGFSVKNVSENDEATFKMLGEGKSYDVFQFESDGMRNVLKRAKPNSIEDLTALNSLYRPGPMDNIDQFIDSKNGREEISYPHPGLEEVLKETYGVIVYQEQVMQVAQIVAGFTLGHADELRRAMGKKIMEIMVKEKKQFISGAVERGYSEKKADEIFELLIPFAGYGFNKSHAAAYSVIAYHTAYLRANFPAEFMAANLSNEINAQDKDKLSECIDEAGKMGIEIDPPDINRSDKLFTVADGRIVYGFLGIKGMGDAPAGEIIKCRAEGPYLSFMDFLNRVDIRTTGKSNIKNLIHTGAFDALGTRRENLLGNLDRAVDYVQNMKEDKKFGQASLFEDSGESEYPEFEFEDSPEIGRAEKLTKEKELIGFYFSGHPLDEYKNLWQKFVKADLGQRETWIETGKNTGSQILIGMIKNIKVITTSRGDKMAFASLEDYNGDIELTFFSGPWGRYNSKIEDDKVAILKGKIDYQRDKDKYSFIVEDYLEPNELDKTAREDEAEERRWDKYRNVWKYANGIGIRILDLKNPVGAESGSYTLIGAVKSIRTHIDKKGKEMAFGSLQNYSGEIDLLFFARTWENCKALALVGEILALKGTINPPNDKNPHKPCFTVSSIMDINKLVRAAAKKAAENGGKEDSTNGGGVKEAVSDETQYEEPYREMHIRLTGEAANYEAGLYSLRDCLDGNPGPLTVFIHVPKASQEGEGETIIRSSEHISADISGSVSALNNNAAVAEVWLEK